MVTSLQVLNGMTLSGLENFVTEQERLLCAQNEKEAARQSSGQPAKDRRTSGKSHGTGSYLHNVAFLVALEKQHTLT